MRYCKIYTKSCVNISITGSCNDAGIFEASDLKIALDNGLINLPAPKELPNCNIKLPFAFVGDEAFPLKTYVMRPYPRRNILEPKHKIFNYRLSRARRTIENTFGIWSSKFLILQQAQQFYLRKIESIILSTICLHNYIITKELTRNPEQQQYARITRENQYVAGREQRLGAVPEQGNIAAIVQRNVLTDYFISDQGSVDWQWKQIRFYM